MVMVSPENSGLNGPGRPQIHHRKEKGHLVGASGKAGYDGKRSNQAITNEVQLLWVKGHCLSSTFRRRVRGGGDRALRSGGLLGPVAGCRFERVGRPSPGCQSRPTGLDERPDGHLSGAVEPGGRGVRGGPAPAGEGRGLGPVVEAGGDSWDAPEGAPRAAGEVAQGTTSQCALGLGGVPVSEPVPR